MITLNSEQGLITVQNWDDIVSLPGFVLDMNPSEHQLEAIIGRYTFLDKIKCGLSNCHTPHGRGYIVTTKAGLKTNIGKDCGKTYFGVDFETLSKKFDRDMTAAENRSYLCSFGFQVDELEAKIDGIRRRPKGADWVHRKAQPLLRAGHGCPAMVVRLIEGMIKTGSNLLTKPREATDEEIDALEATQGRWIQRPHVIEEPVAEISGLQALYPENDLRSLLVLDLTTNLDKFKQLDIDCMTYEELRHWSKWTGTVDTTLDKARAAIESGNALLKPGNLEPFLSVLPKGEERTAFRTYLKELES